MHFKSLQKNHQQAFQMQSYTSIPISNPPPRPAIPIAEGADQAVMKNKTIYRIFTMCYKKYLTLELKNSNKFSI